MRVLASIAVLIATPALAQPWGGSGAQLDKTEMRIGEQVELTLHVDHQRDVLSSVQWPSIGDTLSAHLEIVNDLGIDTLIVDPEGDPDELRQVRVLTITSFDTGYWAVPPFRFRVGGKELETEAILLHVTAPLLDSTNVPKDIKDIRELPFSLTWWVRENAVWITGAGAVALVAVALFLLVARLRRKKPSAAIERAVPLHERILGLLDALDKERIWQQGDHKAYQSRLTDLVRGYIEERYQVPALERTTDELMQELRVSAMSEEHRTQLSNMLHLADMVKFAKALPSPAENEQMMAGAVRFVQSTALKDQRPDAS